MLDFQSSPFFSDVNKCVASAKVVAKEEGYDDFTVWQQIATGNFFYTLSGGWWVMNAPSGECEKIAGFTYTNAKPWPRYALDSETLYEKFHALIAR